MPMDKKKAMKAMDLMIVLGGKPKQDGMKQEDKGESMDKMDHSSCNCPCCGKACAYCNEQESDTEDSYEDSEE